MADRTYYEILDADPVAPKADLKAAYVRALDAAQASGDADAVAAVRRAWQVLSDPVQRQRYDDELRLHSCDAPDAPTVDAATGDGREPGGVADLAEGAPGTGHGSGHGQGQVGSAGRPAFLEQPTIGRRLTASLIDVVTLVAAFLVTITITFQITGADEGAPGLITFIGWVELWILVLFVIPTLRTGQTLGKRLTYVMVVDAHTGNLPSVVQVVRRYAIPMVAIPVLLQMGAFLALFFGLSYAMSRDQLSLADRIAKTVVVIARYRPTRADRRA